MTKIGDIANISNGYAFKSSLYADEGIRVIRITNVQKGDIKDENPKFYPSEFLDDLSNYLINSGDILMSLTGNVGRVGIFPEELCPAFLNQRVARLRVKDSSVHHKYLFYILNSDLFEREAIYNSAGIAQLNLSTKWVSNFKIPLPPLPEQKKIAAILDAADAYRQKTKALIAKYDELTQSLFLDMFGDPVTNPKGWETVTLDSVLSFLTSGSRGWAKFYSEKGATFLRIQNVGYNELRLDDLAFVEAPNSAESKRTKVQANDVVLSITADLGRTAVITEDLSNAHINQHLAILRFNDQIEPVYASAYIASAGGQVKFKKLDKGGVKAGLNFSDIRSYGLHLPPLEIQKKFKHSLEVIANQKEAAEESLRKSENLFNSLLQKAFKGELTGTPQEAAV